MDFDIPTSDLTIAPDRNRMLMSEALRGRVPALEADEHEPDTDDTPTDQAAFDEATAMLGAGTLVVERTNEKGEACHLIGSLILIRHERDTRVGETTSAFGIRLPLDEAWTALEDSAGVSNRRYGGVQAHRGEHDPVLHLMSGPLVLVGVDVTDVTLVGTCTLTLRLRVVNESNT